MPKDPDKRSQKRPTANGTEPANEFDHFPELVRKLVAVPKRELDEARQEAAENAPPLVPPGQSGVRTATPSVMVVRHSSAGVPRQLAGTYC